MTPVNGRTNYHLVLRIMKKFFRTVAGKKFVCNDKGVLEKDADSNFVLLKAEDEENAEEVEQADDSTAEVEKMLAEAVKAVKADSERELSESQVKATDAVTSLFKAITEGAEKHTKIAEEGGVKATLDLESVKGGLKALHENQRNVFSFTLRNKADLDMLAKATSEGDSLTVDVIEPQRVTELTRDPVRAPFIEQIADVTPNMTSDALSYVEVVTESGAPLRTDELAYIPEKDFEFQEFKAPLVKIAVINKHSVELLQDAPQLVNAIRGWLQEDVNIATDEQLLNGDGTGGDISGVFTVASVLDAAAVGTKRVESANLYDVIRVALTKVAVSGKGKFQANYVLLNPEDADALDLTKDDSGQYVLPPFRSADGTTIKGARVIENVGVPAGEFLVGDFRKLHVGTKGGVEVEMSNSDGDDFKKDILTIKLRRRVAAYVRQNDSGAFWTGTIADVITALTAS